MARDKGGRPPRELVYAIGIEPREIRDPGNAGAIGVNQEGYCNLETWIGGGETRTLADPMWIGQTIDLFMTYDRADCVVTAASPINQTGNTTMTFSDVGEHIRLVGHRNPTDGWEWRVVCNDGVALG